MDEKQKQLMRMQQYQYAPQLPFYMSYPQNMYMTELEYERDMERMKELYPEDVKQIQSLVEEECDKMEYEGSMMFDEYPDRVMLKAICDRIGQKAASQSEEQEILEKTYGRYYGTGAFYAQKLDAERIVLERNSHYAGQKAKLKKVVVLRKNYEREKDIVEDLLVQNVDIVITEDSEELRDLIKSRATHASYLIRKKTIETEQPENCLLYRTSYVNAPSIPQRLTEYQSVFGTIHTLKANTL